MSILYHIWIAQRQQQCEYISDKQECLVVFSVVEMAYSAYGVGHVSVVYPLSSTELGLVVSFISLD